MKNLNVQILKLTLPSSQAKHQLSSLLKSNLSHLSVENFGISERTGSQSMVIQNAIENLKQNQKGILSRLENLKPNQKVSINYEINLEIN